MIRIMRPTGAGETSPALEQWDPVDPRAIEHGEGAQSGWRAFHDDDGLSVGLWAATPFTTHLLPYPVHELMIVHEGTITIEDTQGRRECFGPGDVFLIPKSFLGKWIQDGPVLKTFVIFDGGEVSVVPDAPLVRIDPATALERLPALPAEVLASDAPEQHGTVLYRDASDRFRVGIWESGAFATKELSYPYQEAMFVQHGELRIGHAGAETVVECGQDVFVAAGDVVALQAAPGTRKVYVTLRP